MGETFRGVFDSQERDVDVIALDVGAGNVYFATLITFQYESQLQQEGTVFPQLPVEGIEFLEVGTHNGESFFLISHR